MAGTTTGKQQAQRADERRSEERRMAQVPVALQERRKHERRAPVDFSIID